MTMIYYRGVSLALLQPRLSYSVYRESPTHSTLIPPKIIIIVILTVNRGGEHLVLVGT